MNSNNAFRNYRHDISGKFKDISTAIAAMDEHVFNDPENHETFHAIHEVLLKMVNTSRNTILENLKQEIVLVVSDQEPDLTLPKFQIEGVTVRYKFTNEIVTYYLFTLENNGVLEEKIDLITAVLPIKNKSVLIKNEAI